MDYSAELARLEEFVDKLLNKYNQLKSECHALQETLRQRDNECSELKDKIAALSAERTEVGNKVSSLLDRIDVWENEQLHPGVSGYEDKSDSHEALLGDDSQVTTY